MFLAFRVTFTGAIKVQMYSRSCYIFFCLAGPPMVAATLYEAERSKKRALKEEVKGLRRELEEKRRRARNVQKALMSRQPEFAMCRLFHL